MQLKGTHHISLFTRNFAVMEQFYTETLGLPIKLRWDDAKVIFIDLGSTMLELAGRDTAPTPDSPPGAFNHLALHVESVDRAYQELVEKGVRIIREPFNYKHVRAFYIYDPDGNLIELEEDPRSENR